MGCTISLEQGIISKSIQKSSMIQILQRNTSFESHIPSLITSFAVGVIVKCCNSKSRCTRDISISNRFDLHKGMDSDGQMILNLESKHKAGETMSSSQRP